MSQFVPNLHKVAAHRRSWRVSIDPKFAPLIMYSTIMFLAVFGDTIMSYITPVFIENHVSNSFIMGLIFSFSSVVGLVCDMTFPSIFRSKDNIFFIWGTLICALLFPLAYLILPPIIPTLLLAVGIWGIYYEFLSFSNFNFIHAYLTKEHHALAWGILGTFKSLALFVSPLLAAALLHLDLKLPLVVALGFFIAALGGTTVFTKLFPRSKHPYVEEEITKPFRVLSELKVWAVLLKSIWPVYVFIFALFILDSAYWTVGVLLSEEILKYSALGGLILVITMLPALFMGAVVHHAARPFGKKRIAFISGGLAGAILIVTGFAPNPLLLLIGMFCSSLFTSLALPEILAVVQDYVARLDNHSDEMIGIQASAGSLSYIIGPILSGAIATIVGNQLTFSIMGGVLFVISGVCLVVVPRKILLPQNELDRVDKD